MAAHQAPPSLGFSGQEPWSGLPFPSPMHESEKWKWSSSVVSYSSRPQGLQPTGLLRPWGFPGKSTGVGCHRLLQRVYLINLITPLKFPSPNTVKLGVKILTYECGGHRLPRWLSGKESACWCKRHKRFRFNLWVRKIPWRRKWQSTPVLLPGKSLGQRSLVGYSLWGLKELDMTEQLHFHFHK